MSKSTPYIGNLISELDTSPEMTECLNMLLKKLVLMVHTYKVRQLPLPDGRWQTYVKDETKKSKRREIKEPTEIALYKKLALHYGISSTNDTFNDLFYSWCMRQLETYPEGSNTIRRHMQRYNKYFKDCAFVKAAIGNIDILDMEDELNKVISKHNLIQKEWINAKVILNKTFRYAKKKKLIIDSPMEEIEIFVNFAQPKPPEDEEQVYDSNEYHDLISYCWRQYHDSQDQVFLLAIFMFYVGARIGELTEIPFDALTYRKGIPCLHITHSLCNVPYLDDDGKWHDNYQYMPHTKSYRARKVDLIPKALEIVDLLKELNPHYTKDTLMFKRPDGRKITERAVNYVYEKYAERKNSEMPDKLEPIIVKRSHKARKTYASRLNDSGTQITTIAKDLGHASTEMTRKFYVFNSLPREKVYEKKASAF